MEVIKVNIDTLENHSIVSQKVKHKATMWPNISLLGIYLREMKTYVHIKTCTGLLIGALFMMASNWKQLKWPSVDE